MSIACITEISKNHGFTLNDSYLLDFSNRFCVKNFDTEAIGED